MRLRPFPRRVGQQLPNTMSVWQGCIGENRGYLFNPQMAKDSCNDLTAPAKDARSFDAWFYSQTERNQKMMREKGVFPYAEMRKAENVFEVIPSHPGWKDVNKKDELRTETEQFISRDHVGTMLKAFIDALAVSDSMAVRRHVELVRWAMALPGCMTSRELSKLYGRSHTYVENHARIIREQINRDACGLFPAMMDVKRTGKGSRSNKIRKIERFVGQVGGKESFSPPA